MKSSKEAEYLFQSSICFSAKFGVFSSNETTIVADIAIVWLANESMVLTRTPTGSL